MLVLKNVVKTFDALRAVDGVSLEVKKGSIIGLIGPNGSGKSTLFNSIAGFYKPDGGEIYFEGKLINGLKSNEIFDRGIVRSFQMPRLFTGMTVLSNALVPPRNQKGEKTRYAPFHRSWRDQEIANARKSLKVTTDIHLDEVIRNLATDISGGQMKLLELARSLMGEPKLLLLDEPTAGVAPRLAEEIFEGIVSLRNEFGITCFIIEHRLELLFDYVEHIFVMHQGKILAEGTKEEILNNEMVVKVYLGDFAIAH
ncbi:MAG: ABC transporter ATP-binding protein [Nitrososphaerales archaeon]|jgi:branched-chain amino acid transport system ATP-binding protein